MYQQNFLLTPIFGNICFASLNPYYPLNPDKFKIEVFCKRYSLEFCGQISQQRQYHVAALLNLHFGVCFCIFYTIVSNI